MDAVDAVAQAIRDYLSNQRAEGMYYDDTVGLSTEVRIDGLLDVDALALAAIDALGLTEEWRCIGWVFTRDEEAAQKQHAANGGEVQSRLVSGWVRKDNTNE